MFYAAPVPVANDFNVVHQVSQRALGEDHGAGPSEKDPQQLIVKEKMFSWGGNNFEIKTLSGGRFGNNLFVKGKAFALIDEMVLLDGVTKKAVAVCRRKFNILGQTFQIYSPKPLYHWQRPSGSSYMGRQLYTFAKVERSPLSTTQKVTYDNETSASMTITRTVLRWPKKRVVHRHGKTAAFIEGGTWTGNFNTYRVTVNPGIDPCLIICLTAICDEMDE
ncbi:LURP-one-related protein [Nitzschia inconspicua]|uniref:LURP-one-related protein n=1 Tax=Nitzschia inconspicua TaxID=303405 RepID=A0A9K3Q7A4_9STRA|nr:LURP-one-related protein [Nitzschia inconspicua]